MIAIIGSALSVTGEAVESLRSKGTEFASFHTFPTCLPGLKQTEFPFLDRRRFQLQIRDQAAQPAGASPGRNEEIVETETAEATPTNGASQRVSPPIWSG